jgi:flagellar biosynthetic protein FliR
VPAVGPLLPPMPQSPAALTLLVAGEALIGIFIGTIARILVSALHTAGTTIAYTSAMANAMIPDPVTQQQGAIVAGAVGTIGLVLLFVTDLHHLMLRAAFESYTLFEPGRLPPMGDMSEMVTREVSGAFRLGVQLAAPFLVISFGFYVVLGLVSRLMPSFPVFFIGLPLQQLLAFTLLVLTLSAIMMVFLAHFDEQMRAFTVP